MCKTYTKGCHVPHDKRSTGSRFALALNETTDELSLRLEVHECGKRILEGIVDAESRIIGNDESNRNFIKFR